MNRGRPPHCVKVRQGGKTTDRAGKRGFRNSPSQGREERRSMHSRDPVTKYDLATRRLLAHTNKLRGSSALTRLGRLKNYKTLHYVYWGTCIADSCTWTRSLQIVKLSSRTVARVTCCRSRGYLSWGTRYFHSLPFDCAHGRAEVANRRVEITAQVNQAVTIKTRGLCCEDGGFRFRSRMGALVKPLDKDV